jgi:3-oxoacyl-[acyl-carrier protein] reductase
MLLASRVALVTGASKGIGRGIALEKAREGADVVINYARSDKEAKEVARDIEALGRRALVIRADVSNPEEVERMRRLVLKEFDGVGILVNNAGIHRHLKSWQMDHEEWKRVLGVNLDGVFLCSKAFSSEMKAKKWGRIISISSIIAFTGTDHEAHYGASKAGVVGLTKSLALELGGYKIIVNAIAPGWIETDMTSGMRIEERKKGLFMS